MGEGGWGCVMRVREMNIGRENWFVNKRSGIVRWLFMGEQATKRTRRFRRSWQVQVLGALIVVVLIVRLVWGWWVGRQLQAQLDEIRRRGEPAAVSDIVFAGVADEQNAWTYQTRAAKAISEKAESPSNSNLEYPDYPSFPAEWTKLARASEQANAEAFALARQARRYSQVQTRRELPSPLTVAVAIHSSVNEVKNLANVLADAAMYSHFQGDDVEAIERLLDLLHLSRSLRQDDFLVSQLVSNGMEAQACHAAFVIGPGLRLDRAATNSAMGKRVQRLIAELMDETLPDRGLRRSVAMERLSWIDVLRYRGSKTWFIRPLAEQQMLRAIQGFEFIAQASQCNNNAQSQDIVKRYTWEKGQGMDMGEQMLRMMFKMPPAKPTIPRYSRWFYTEPENAAWIERHFRTLGERRAAATALACQVYRADHGQWPQRLDQLVPEFLPAVPRDPYCADERSIGYLVLKTRLPGGGDRPLLYFDAGATDIPIPDQPAYAWMSDLRPGGHRGSIRQYRDITWFEPGKSTKAIYHDP